MNAYAWAMIETAQAPGRAILAKRGDDRPGLVIKADYAVLPADPDGRLTPMPQPNAAALVTARRLGLDGLRAPDPPREKPFTQAGGAAFWTFGLLVVALSFWVSGGHVLFWP
ncbi:MAG TPA: hypothetical protein VGN97_14140 [Mesorhizobium sp.]|nr:hypothetical protein [Mesorhizobium sp.]